MKNIIDTIAFNPLDIKRNITCDICIIAVIKFLRLNDGKSSRDYLCKEIKERDTVF